MSDFKLAISLNRTKGSIVFIGQELGLFRQIQKQKWLEWELEFLKENFKAVGQDYITEVLSPYRLGQVECPNCSDERKKRNNPQI